MAIVRMYRSAGEGALEFREAWFQEYADAPGRGEFVVNHGTVGRLSTTATERDVDAAEGESLLDAFAAQGAEDGYAQIAAEDQHWVIAQYALKTADGTARDEHLRARATEALAAHLAWRGLGTVESSDFAPHKLNIRMLSPEPKAAAAAVVSCLREAKLDFTKLAVAVAPHGEPDALRQRHPMPPKGRFTLD